jgi:hypothetical protein
MTTAPLIHTEAIADGTYWTIGYEWSFAESAAALKQIAQAEAKLSTVEADVIAYRDEQSHPQFGLGRTDARDRRRGGIAAIAFAEALATQTIQTGCGLFELPSGKYWLVEVDRDQIPPDGDRVFDDRSKALAAFAETLSKHRRVSRIYAPPALIQESREAKATRVLTKDGTDLLYMILARHDANDPHGSEDASPTPLDQLLAGHRRNVHERVKRASDYRHFMPVFISIIGVSLLALTVSLGYIYVLPLWASPPPPAPVAVIIPAPPPAPVIRTPVPIVGVPATGTWLRGCFTAMAELDDHLPSWGWTPTGYECGRGQVVARFRRTEGGFDELEGSYPQLIRTYASNYDTADVVMPLPDVVTRPRNAVGELMAHEDLRRRLFAMGWETGEAVTVSVFAPPANREPEDRAVWQQAELTITSQIDPDQWADLLDPYPGLVMTALMIDPTKLRNDPKTAAWTMKGIFYAN